MRKALVVFRAGATEQDAQNSMAKRAQDGGGGSAALHASVEEPAECRG